MTTARDLLPTTMSGDRLLETVSGAWPMLSIATSALPHPDRVTIERVTPLDSEFVIAVEASSAGRTVGVNVIVAGDRAPMLRHHLIGSLAKRSRGQIPRDRAVGPVLVTPGLVVVASGQDRRINALGAITGGVQADRLAARVGLEKGSQVTLLSHRYGKRAIMRVRSCSGSAIVKAYKARAPLASLTARWGKVLSDAELSPAALGEIEDQTAVIWRDLGDTEGPGQWDAPSPSTLSASVRLLRRLHSTSVDAVPFHGPADEIAVARRMVDLVTVARPEWADAFGRALNRVSARMPGATSNARIVHRDAHPGQFRSGRVFDLDTLAVSDPTLDIANYAAHLTLAGEGDRLEEVLDAYGPDGGPHASFGTWHDISLLRLAGQKVLVGDNGAGRLVESVGR